MVAIILKEDEKISIRYHDIETLESLKESLIYEWKGHINGHQELYICKLNEHSKVGWWHS